MVQWEDLFDRDDEDEQPEPWQQAGRPEGEARIPAVYGIREPSACTLLDRLAEQLGAVTGVFDYAATARYVATRLRIRARWPRLCQDCGAQFRGPRAELVRCSRCRNRRRARR